MRMRCLPVVAISIGFLLNQGALAQPLPPNDQLDAMIAAGQYAEAYALANQNLNEWEGDTEFDFLYALAALEAGYPNESVFALERVVNTGETAVVRSRARLELARAYYLTNNLAASENLFNQVLATNPPQNVRDNIQVFLLLIDANLRSQQSEFKWSLAADVGHDDNINSSTSESLIDTPLIGEIELDPDGLKASDRFTDINLTMAYRRFYTRDKTLNFNLNFNRRDNLSTDQFDMDSIRADLSYSHTAGRHRFRYAVQTQQVMLDSTSFQSSAGLGVSWQRAGNSGWYQSLTGSYTALRFDNKSSPNNDLRDANQALVSFGLTRIGNSTTNNTAIYYADEDALESLGHHNGRSYYGFAHSVFWRMSSVHTPYARFNIQELEHADNHPVFFNDTRSDTTLSATLGWLWQFNRRLLLNGEYNYTESDSNINLFAYSRSRFQAGFRFQF